MVRKENIMAVTGDKVGKELLDALGLNVKNVHDLQVLFSVGRIAELRIYSYVEDDDVDKLKAVLTKYKLVEVD